MPRYVPRLCGGAANRVSGQAMTVQALLVARQEKFGFLRMDELVTLFLAQLIINGGQDIIEATFVGWAC